MKKSTEELENILQSTHAADFQKYYQEHQDSLSNEDNPFGIYIKELLHQHGLTQQIVFLKGDIPERYGYKLLSGEKRTKQRDIILRICYAGELSLAETQKALKKYEMLPLYAKTPRDALLMIIFNQRPGSIIDVNELLKNNGFSPLRSSGLQE